MIYGRLDAINAVDLEMRLKRMELDLVTATQLAPKTLFGGRKIPRPELINFCFHLEQLSRAGVAAGLVAVPLRYMHTPGEVLSLADMDNTVALLAAFIRLITPETSFIPMA